MNPALILVHRDIDGSTVAMPFAYKSGEMMTIIEEIVEYITGMDLVDSVWEGIAADRLRIILEQKVKLQEAEKRAQDNEELAAWYRENGIVREAIGR